MAETKEKSRSKGRWIAAGIFALALTVRLVYLYQISASTTFLIPIVDSSAYLRAAKLLAEGGGLAPAFFWQAFFYPLFLACVCFFSNSSIICAKVIQMLLGSAVCVLAFHLGRRLFDRRTGVVAGIFVALYGPLIYFDGELLATVWASIWALVLIGLFLRAGEKRNIALYAALGICGGLSIITRATFLPFFAVSCIWLIWALRRTNLRWIGIAGRAGVLVAGVLIVIIPVAILCAQVTGRFSALPETGPLNLHMGNNAEQPRYMAIRPGSEWTELMLLPARHGARDKMAEYRFFADKVRDYVAARPGHFVVGLIRKSVHFVSSREIPSNSDMYAMRDHSWLFSFLTWKTQGFGFPFGLLLPLALLGMVRRWRQVPGPVILFLVLYPAVIILVFVTARYRAPMIPVLAILAAAGFWDIEGRVAARRWRQVAAALVAAAVVAVVTSLPGPFEAEMIDYESERFFCLGSELERQDRLEQAASCYREGLKLTPNYSEGYHGLAGVLVKQRKFEEAVQLYKKAIEIAPGHFWYHYSLGAALVQDGKVNEGIPHYLRAVKLSPYHLDAPMPTLPSPSGHPGGTRPK